MKNSIVKGDIFYSSWGWDQTNISFFQVVNVKTEKTIVIQKIKSKRVEYNLQPMTGLATPVIDEFVGDMQTKRVRADGTIRINSYSSASLWDGRPKECSWYA